MLVECGFCFIANIGKSGGIVYGDVRENFTVKIDTCNLEAVHKARI